MRTRCRQRAHGRFRSQSAGNRSESNRLQTLAGHALTAIKFEKRRDEAVASTQASAGPVTQPLSQDSICSADPMPARWRASWQPRPRPPCPPESPSCARPRHAHRCRYRPEKALCFQRQVQRRNGHLRTACGLVFGLQGHCCQRRLARQGQQSLTLLTGELSGGAAAVLV